MLKASQEAKEKTEGVVNSLILKGRGANSYKTIKWIIFSES